MKNKSSKQYRILAIAPSSRGFGYAIMEGEEKLVDWGVKLVAGDMNGRSLAKVEEMINHYEPQVIALEDCQAEGSKRSKRIRALSEQIIVLAESRKIKVKLFARLKIYKAFFPNGQGTKHGVAEILAKRFPDELGSRLPPKRKPWMSEDYRMDIFDAVALVMSLKKLRHRQQT